MAYLTKHYHQLGDTDIEEGEGVASRDQQDLDTPSLSDQPRDLDTEAGILATAPALIENSSISVLSVLTKTV